MSRISDWFRRMNPWGADAPPTSLPSVGDPRPSQDDGSDSPAAISIPFSSLPGSTTIFGNKRSRLQMQVLDHPLTEYDGNFIVRVSYDPSVRSSEQQPFGAGFYIDGIFPLETTAEALAERIMDTATEYENEYFTENQRLAMASFAGSIIAYDALCGRHSKTQAEIVSIVRAFFGYLRERRVFGLPQAIRGET